MVSDESREQDFRLAAAGNREAFASLVRQNQSLVYSLAWHYLADKAAAEELAQDVFLELYRMIHSLDSDRHATNWLRRVTVHRCIDQARKQKHRPKIGLDEIAEPTESGQQPDLLLTEKLRKLVASLPEKARVVVVLRYEEDLEPAEIAQTLSMPLSTVRSYLQRSLTMLREKLERIKVSL